MLQNGEVAIAHQCISSESITRLGFLLDKVTTPREIRRYYNSGRGVKLP